MAARPFVPTDPYEAFYAALRDGRIGSGCDVFGLPVRPREFYSAERSDPAWSFLAHTDYSAIGDDD